MYDEYEEIRKLFPVFNVIQAVHSRLNLLLKHADEQGLSIKFIQANKQLKTASGNFIDGPPEPHIHMTTFSWQRPSNDND
ncbi:MAG: hypothetical protein HC836_25670 [Richelia sp. RM2_1_2]|nr:hypothetical protein [Richelia sp. RM2_1_2]